MRLRLAWVCLAAAPAAQLAAAPAPFYLYEDLPAELAEEKLAFAKRVGMYKTYTVEHELPALLAAHPLRVSDPAAAAAFIVPFPFQAVFFRFQFNCQKAPHLYHNYFSPQAHPGLQLSAFEFCQNAAAAHLEEAVGKVLEHLGGARTGAPGRDAESYWSRHGGRDHVFISPMAYGRCVANYFETLVAPRRFDALESSVFLANFGVAGHNCSVAGRDIVIPTYMNLTAARETGVAEWWGAAGAADAERPILAFYRGTDRAHDKYEGYRFRLLIRDHLSDAEGFDVGGAGLGYRDYLERMSNADFALCPGGTSPWSPRLVESIYAGCVPVLFYNQDKQVLPFADAIPWDDVAVFIHEDDIPRTPEILRALAHDVPRRRALLRDVFRKLSYETMEGEGACSAAQGAEGTCGIDGHRGNAVDMILERIGATISNE